MDQQVGNKIKETLENNPFLSDTFKNWYFRILLDIAKDNVTSGYHITQGLNEVDHPFQFIERLNELGEKKEVDLSFRIQTELVNTFPQKIKKDVLYTTSSELYEKSAVDNFDKLVSNLPPISSTCMFLDTNTSPKLFILRRDFAFVVVQVDSYDYVQNYLTIKSILEEDIQDKSIQTIENVGYIETNKFKYFLSEFKGFDYETSIIDQRKIGLNSDLLAIAKKLEAVFKKHHIFFRNLAPRNLIRGDDGITYVIDFDHTYNLDINSCSEIEDAYLSRYLWFSDLFKQKEIEEILGKRKAKIVKGATSPADKLERHFFGKDKVTPNERDLLYKLSYLLECRDNVDNLHVYGHQLGRFISDFWKIESESSLLRYIHDNPKQLRTLRANLYLLSRVDQELLLRKRCSLDSNLPLLSERYMKKVIKTKNSVRLFNHETKQREDFRSQYSKLRSHL